MFHFSRSYPGEFRQRIARIGSAWRCSWVQIGGRRQEPQETQGKATGGNAQRFFDRLLRPCVNDRLRLAVGGVVNNNLLRGNALQRSEERRVGKEWRQRR